MFPMARTATMAVGLGLLGTAALRSRTQTGSIRGSYHRLMSKLLMNLRNVPDDEADDVRAMLDAQGIPFYETRPSMWGTSAGGIWVTEDDAFADARRAMDDYQQQRSMRVRAEYAAAKRAGTADTFWTMLRADPERVVLSVLGILVVLGLVVLPFILLRG